MVNKVLEVDSVDAPGADTRNADPSHSIAEPPSTVTEALAQICAQNPRRKHARDLSTNRMRA